MVLAAQAIMRKKYKRILHKLRQYIPTITFIRKSKNHTEITIKEFFEMTGHKISHSNVLSDFSNDDFKSVSAIESFSLSHDKLLLQINSKSEMPYKDKYNKVKVPTSGLLEINKTAN